MGGRRRKGRLKLWERWGIGVGWMCRGMGCGKLWGILGRGREGLMKGWGVRMRGGRGLRLSWGMEG